MNAIAFVQLNFRRNKIIFYDLSAHRTHPNQVSFSEWEAMKRQNVHGTRKGCASLKLCVPTLLKKCTAFTQNLCGQLGKQWITQYCLRNSGDWYNRLSSKVCQDSEVVTVWSTTSLKFFFSSHRKVSSRMAIALDSFIWWRCQFCLLDWCVTAGALTCYRVNFHLERRDWLVESLQVCRPIVWNWSVITDSVNEGVPVRL
jgi:hypothetical protein